jgi:hypothetical protein
MSEHNDFEGQVAESLKRVEAPAGFAERLMARAVVETHIAEASRSTALRVGAPGLVSAGKAKIIAFPRARSVWMSGAVAAALVVGTFVGVDKHRQHERERATQEFETATRITDQALEHTRDQLARAGVRLEE